MTSLRANSRRGVKAVAAAWRTVLLCAVVCLVPAGAWCASGVSRSVGSYCGMLQSAFMVARRHMEYHRPAAAVKVLSEALASPLPAGAGESRRVMALRAAMEVALADALFRTGETDEALRLALKVERREGVGLKTRAVLYRLLARIYGKKGDSSRAAAYYDKALAVFKKLSGRGARKGGSEDAR